MLMLNLELSYSPVSCPGLTLNQFWDVFIHFTWSDSVFLCHMSYVEDSPHTEGHNERPASSSRPHEFETNNLSSLRFILSLLFCKAARFSHDL